MIKIELTAKVEVDPGHSVMGSSVAGGSVVGSGNPNGLSRTL